MVTVMILTPQMVFANISQKCNVNIISYDYLEYGLTKSNNIPLTEHNCYECLETVINFIIELGIELGIEKKNIILMGYSLETGILIDFAAKEQWSSRYHLQSN